MKIAALDLGTNTFLCLVCEVENGQVTRVYDDCVEMVRLGQDVRATGKFHADALTRAEKALKTFRQIIDQHQPERILAMATSAARDVSNAQSLFDICKKLAIPVQIIPGGQEAQITFQGTTSAFSPSQKENRLVVDVGGGSTEFIFGVGRELRWGKSLNIGCVRLKEKWLDQFPPEAGTIQKISEDVRRELETLQQFAEFQSPGKIGEVIAVAGTPTELARIEVGEFVVEKIDGFRLSGAKLEHWLKDFSGKTPEQITNAYQVSPGRADVLLVGVIILLETLRALQKSELIVSTRGVRYGVALEVGK